MCRTVTRSPTQQAPGSQASTGRLISLISREDRVIDVDGREYVDLTLAIRAIAGHSSQTTWTRSRADGDPGRDHHDESAGRHRVGGETRLPARIHGNEGQAQTVAAGGVVGRVGAGITLIVVGAILTFALRADIPGLGEYALGLILIFAGVLLLVLHFVAHNQRRHSRTVVEKRGPVVEDRGEVIEEEPVVERRRRRRIV